MAAPVGKGRLEAETVNVPEPALAVTVPDTTGVPAFVVFEAMVERVVLAVPWLEAVAAPVGRGREEALTGCVTPDPSTFRAVMLEIP